METNKEYSLEDILQLLPRTREADLYKLNPAVHKLVTLLVNGAPFYAVLDEALVYLSKCDQYTFEPDGIRHHQQ